MTSPGLGELATDSDPSKEDDLAENLATYGIRSTDSSEYSGSRREKKQHASTLPNLWEQAHALRKRQRQSEFKKWVSAVGLVASLTLGSLLLLRYFTPKAKRPRRVGDRPDDIYGGYAPPQVDYSYFYDSFQPSQVVTTRSDGRRPVVRPRRRALSEPADIDRYLDTLYGPLPETGKRHEVEGLTPEVTGSSLYSQPFVSDLT